MASTTNITAQAFSNFLLQETPNFDPMIERDIRPEFSDTLGYFDTESWDPYTGVTHTLDRFKAVQADPTILWNPTPEGSCTGAPCDPQPNEIGWGSQRYTFSRTQLSINTPVLCFDAIMQRNKAVEHMEQVISEVLMPATRLEQSYFNMRQILNLADDKLCVAAGGITPFTFNWDAGGYVYLNTSQDPAGILTSQILRTQANKQYFLGANTENSAGTQWNPMDLMTDIDTFHYLSVEDPILQGAWRFGEFSGKAEEFYKYGFRGYVGDYLCKTLFSPLRFNKVSAGRYQLVLPYVNQAVTEGIGDTYNTAFDNALYQMSFKTHRKAIRIMPFRASPVNAKMPFRIRDYAGQWFWANSDLPQIVNGNVVGTIPNPRGNKGMFIGDFDIGVRPSHTEWLQVWFHQRQPPCVQIISTCATDPGYPTQTYSMANVDCLQEIEIQITEVLGAGQSWRIAANAITCNGDAVTHGAVSGNTLAALVNSLNANVSSLGTWSVVTNIPAGTNPQNYVIMLTGTCQSLGFPVTVS
jgi:hypothetical protein